MDEGFSFREAATWVISVLAVAVSGLSRKIWKGHEARMDDIESEHKQHAHDLTAHAVWDAASHDVIKKDLSSAIERLNTKIDDTTNELSKQMTTQHGMLAGRIDRVLELFVEAKK